MLVVGLFVMPVRRVAWLGCRFVVGLLFGGFWFVFSGVPLEQ